MNCFGKVNGNYTERQIAFVSFVLEFSVTNLLHLMKSCRFEMQAWLNVSGKRCRENERLLTFGLMLTKMCIFRLMYRRLDHILDGKFRNLTLQVVILFHCVIKFTSFYFLHVVFFFPAEVCKLLLLTYY